MTKPVDNDPTADRQEQNPETASNASDTPPPDDEPTDPEPPPKRKRGRPKLTVVKPGDRQSDDEPEPDEPEPEPGEPDSDEDPEVEPKKPGHRAKWRLVAFVNSMYRDPNFPWPSVEWRKKTPKGSDIKVIDVGDDENRMAALALIGVADLTYDHADGTFRYRRISHHSIPPSDEEIAKSPWRSFTDMADEERRPRAKATGPHRPFQPQHR